MNKITKVLVSSLSVVALVLGVYNLANSVKKSNMYAKVEMDLEVGDIYFESNNFLKAAQVYEDILEHKFEVEALSKLATSYYNLDDFDASLESAIKLVDLVEDNPEYLIIKAQSLTGLGRYAESIAILDGLSKSEPDVLVAYAKNDLAQGQIDLALENAFKAVDLNPSSENAVVMLSDIYVYEKNYTAASRVLNNGYELTKSEALLERIEHIALTFNNN